MRYLGAGAKSSNDWVVVLVLVLAVVGTALQWCSDADLE